MAQQYVNKGTLLSRLGIGGLNGYLMNRERQNQLTDTAQQQQFRSQEIAGQQQFQLQRDQASDAAATDRIKLEHELRGKENAAKPQDQGSQLKFEQEVFNLFQDEMQDATPEAVRAAVADYKGGYVWETINRRYPNGYPKIVKPGAEPKKTYDSVQDAFKDASQRFGQDYTPDSIHAISLEAFQKQEDVGMVEAGNRSGLQRSPYGIAKQRTALKGAITGIDDSLNPAQIEATIDEVSRREKSGEVGDKVFNESIDLVRKNTQVIDVLTEIGRDPNSRAEPIDIGTLNTVSQYQFVPPPEGEATLQDVIIDALAQGMDARQIQVLLSNYDRASMIGPRKPEREVQMVPSRMGAGGI